MAASLMTSSGPHALAPSARVSAHFKRQPSSGCVRGGLDATGSLRQKRPGRGRLYGSFSSAVERLLRQFRPLMSKSEDPPPTPGAVRASDSAVAPAKEVRRRGLVTPHPWHLL